MASGRNSLSFTFNFVVVQKDDSSAEGLETPECVPRSTSQTREVCDLILRYVSGPHNDFNLFE